MSALLRAIAEPRRQQILRLVWDEEQSAGTIAAACDEVTFGAISQHLKVLREAGAITQRKAGRQRFYRADRAALGSVALYLEEQWRTHLSDLKTLAEAEERSHASHDHPVRR